MKREMFDYKLILSNILYLKFLIMEMCIIAEDVMVYPFDMKE